MHGDDLAPKVLEHSKPRDFSFYVPDPDTKAPSRRSHVPTSKGLGYFGGTRETHMTLSSFFYGVAGLCMQGLIYISYFTTFLVDHSVATWLLLMVMPGRTELMVAKKKVSNSKGNIV